MLGQFRIVNFPLEAIVSVHHLLFKTLKMVEISNILLLFHYKSLVTLFQRKYIGVFMYLDIFTPQYRYLLQKLSINWDLIILIQL